MNEPAPTTWPAAPTDGIIAIEFEYAANELARVSAGVWIRGWHLWFVAALTLTPLVAFVNWEGIAAGEWWWWFGASFGVLLVWGFNLWSVHLTAARLQRESATASGPMKFVFGPDRVWITGNGFREEVRYSVFYGAEETREHILLMLNSMFRYAVPKRAIPNPQTLATLRQTINQGLPGNAKRRLK